jgi:hypothetical protein
MLKIRRKESQKEVRKKEQKRISEWTEWPCPRIPTQVSSFFLRPSFAFSRLNYHAGFSKYHLTTGNKLGPPTT